MRFSIGPRSPISMLKSAEHSKKGKGYEARQSSLMFLLNLLTLTVHKPQDVHFCLSN